MAGTTIAFDLGSGTIKCGPITDPSPSVCIPAMVGHRSAPKAKNRLLRKTADPSPSAAEGAPIVEVGDVAATSLRSGAPMSVHWPIEHGVVKRWDDMEHIIRRCFEDLLVTPSEVSVVFAVPPFNPTDCTERLVQMFFETFDVERVATVQQGLCALYASGRSTGIVLDVGHGLTTVTPVFDSFVLEKTMNRMHTGGADVGDHLRRLMYEQGHSFTTPLDLLNLNELKEASALVAPDYEAALKSSDEPFRYRHEMPDGSSLELAKERFRSTEILFDPSIVHSETTSLPDFVQKAIQGCPIDHRRAISGNIILSGGTTTIDGFRERLQAELAARFPGLFGAIHVFGDPHRTAAVWSGAAVLANMPTFEPHFVTRDVYDEHGPSVIHGYYDHSLEKQMPKEEADGVDGDLGDEDDVPPPPPPDSDDD